MNLKNNNWFSLLEKRYFVYPLVCFLSLIIFSWLQSGVTLSDPDSFYHAQIINLISQNGLVQNMPWLSATLLHVNFTDHHLLYHLLLLPLLAFTNAIVAVKIGSVLLSTCFVLLLVYYLYQNKTKFILVYPLLLLTLYPFLIRMSLPKASPLALILLLLGIYFFEKQKKVLLFFAAFLYVWAHGGFILLLAVVGIFCLTDLLFNLIKKNKINFNFYLKNILIVFLGLISGLIINPYFPKNLGFYWQQVVQIGLINYQDKIEVGAEWYAYKIGELIGMTSVACILIVLALVVFIFYIKKQSLKHWQWFFLSIFLLIATLRSRRFVEYFIPIVIIFVAYIFSWYWQSGFYKNNLCYLKNIWQKKKKRIILLFIYLIIAIFITTIKNLWFAKQELDSGFSVYLWQDASNYLKEHSDAGDIVFHGSWDDFPILFYQNSKNYYLVGLDATFMYNYNQQLYQDWVDISSGKINENLAKIISEKFSAKYIFIENQIESTKLFHAYIKRDPKIKLKYHDQDCSIYQIY